MNLAILRGFSCPFRIVFAIGPALIAQLHGAHLEPGSVYPAKQFAKLLAIAPTGIAAEHLLRLIEGVMQLREPMRARRGRPLTHTLTPPPACQLRDVPSAGSAAAFIPRPPSLAAQAEAFALVVPDDAMVPRFRQGMTIAVVPGLDVEIGDDLLLMLNGTTDPSVPRPAVPGRCAHRGQDRIALALYSGPATETFPLVEVGTIARIAGELI